MTQLNHKPLRPQAPGNQSQQVPSGRAGLCPAGPRKALVAEKWPLMLAELQGWIFQAVLRVSEPGR